MCYHAELSCALKIVDIYIYTGEPPKWGALELFSLDWEACVTQRLCPTRLSHAHETWAFRVEGLVMEENPEYWAGLLYNDVSFLSYLAL